MGRLVASIRLDALSALAAEGLLDPPCDLLLEVPRHGGFPDASR
ncbi:hypothetical protein [Sinorhizobium americanum]|uniref:Uncharacterized protein n=1 Tax=Sinorhizobium americanum TaxID=194963 RepID=A0A1L3LV38_9HYPH|nr:hypothetical protein [Sinorhizobium americanum]APG93955.1 hypothetical protein SAMCFNEI73_pC0233 [Sinorhizobium americanum]